jgi:hypothetical protein
MSNQQSIVLLILKAVWQHIYTKQIATQIKPQALVKHLANNVKVLCLTIKLKARFLFKKVENKIRLKVKSNHRLSCIQVCINNNMDTSICKISQQELKCITPSTPLESGGQKITAMLTIHPWDTAVLLVIEKTILLTTVDCKSTNIVRVNQLWLSTFNLKLLIQHQVNLNR